MEPSCIWSALAEIQKGIEQPLMDSEGHAGKNGARTYKYASLAAVRKSVIPPCNERGIFITQHFDGDNVLITEARMGEQSAVLDRRTVAITGSSQSDGSAETYAKRYALCSVFGLVGIEDDDGSAASETKQRRREGAFGGKCRSCGSTAQFQSSEQFEAYRRKLGCCANPDYEVI